MSILLVCVPFDPKFHEVTWKGTMDRTLSLSTSKSYVESLTSIVTVYGDRVFKR